MCDLPEKQVLDVVSNRVTNAFMEWCLNGLHRRVAEVKGWEVILVVVDQLSKYAYFLLLEHPYTAKSVAEVFVKEVV